MPSPLCQAYIYDHHRMQILFIYLLSKPNWPLVLQLISEEKKANFLIYSHRLSPPDTQYTRKRAQVEEAYLFLEDWDQRFCLKAPRGGFQTKGRTFCFRELEGHPEKLNSLLEGIDWKWDGFKKSLNKFMEIYNRFRKCPNLMTHYHGQACPSTACVREKLLDTLRLAWIQCGISKSLLIKAI